MSRQAKMTKDRADLLSNTSYNNQRINLQSVLLQLNKPYFGHKKTRRFRLPTGITLMIIYT
ncbi:MAG: hypothetical protein ABFC98_01570 [Candidatus Cloacimonas sp.]